MNTIEMHLSRALVALALSFGVASGAVGSPFAVELVDSSNVTAFGSGVVTGPPDDGGLFLGSSPDSPQQLGTLTLRFDPFLNQPFIFLLVRQLFLPDAAFTVELSADNLSYVPIGTFSGSDSAIDIGSYSGIVAFARLTGVSHSVSAGIDAVEWAARLCDTDASSAIGALSCPEPASIALFAVALAGSGFVRRRR